MGKAARRVRTAGASTPVDPGTIAVVGQREPCPCGSTKKYKLCHGRVIGVPTNERPFEGLPQETEWIALREIIPAGTATVRLRESGREITVASILPMMWPALHRRDEAIFLALQSNGPADLSRNLAAALTSALASEPGTQIATSPAGTARLQELLDPTHPFEVTVHSGFDFWMDTKGPMQPGAREALEQANHSVVPTERVLGVTSAYWCRLADRCHLRWVLAEPEDDLLDGLARLHAVGGTSLGEGTRYIGAFRAHGLLVPVWDLPSTLTAAQLQEPAQAFRARLSVAAAQTAPLTSTERRARAGVLSRQLTLR